MIIITTIIINNKSTAATEKYDRRNTRPHTHTSHKRTFISWHSIWSQQINVIQKKEASSKKEKKQIRRRNNRVNVKI